MSELGRKLRKPRSEYIQSGLPPRADVIAACRDFALCASTGH
jgi:hypothetical protein